MFRHKQSTEEFHGQVVFTWLPDMTAGIIEKLGTIGNRYYAWNSDSRLTLPGPWEFVSPIKKWNRILT